MAIESGRILLEMINQGPDDPMCCPNQDSSREYVLEGAQLNLVEKSEKPRDKPAVPLHVEPERIRLAPGTTSVVIEGSIFPIGSKQYVLSAEAGQTMAVTVTSPYDHVFLSSYGVRDDVVLVGIRSEATTWIGQVPSSQDYAINLVSVAGSETAFTLQIDSQAPAPPGPELTPTPPPKPTQMPGDVIYLTFDDGPVDPRWTPQVLEALARHDAKATFFILGQLAQRFPELIQAEVDAGHSVGNHTFDHRTLDGIGREAFFNELLATEKALGDKGSKCMRPPYGATDAYTVAYAAELGYKVVLWDIDTQDWRRPGAWAIASEVLEAARPGAVVLMHDGGGDRTQTVEALDTVLTTLSDQGYTFEALCR
jgi:peptidoglycan/xylan/chitin deacetylase (PgdA/CDA1 family)